MQIYTNITHHILLLGRRLSNTTISATQDPGLFILTSEQGAALLYTLDEALIRGLHIEDAALLEVRRLSSSDEEPVFSCVYAGYYADTREQIEQLCVHLALFQEGDE